MLVKTTATKTCKRAPGPGAIKKTDWRPLATKRLEGRKIVLHTDSARSYKMRIPGVVHDSVRHCKKRVKVGKKWVWKKPVYVRLAKHVLPDGSKLTVKAGTQVIDRTWRFLRAHLRGLNSRPGAFRLSAAIRSAQWLYWKRGADLWKETGVLLKATSWR